LVDDIEVRYLKDLPQQKIEKWFEESSRGFALF
jgi:hypothetical protein